MNRFFKRFALLLVVAIAAVCMGVFAAACGDDNGGNSAYSVTVLYPDGKPVDGANDGTGGVTADGLAGTEVKVQWCKITNGTPGTCTIPETIGSDGTYSADLNPLGENESYHIILTGLPEGYTFEDNYFPTEPGNVTIYLIAIDN